MSSVRQNYHEESEGEVNKMTNRLLSSSYTYLSMAFHFQRDDVALPGAAKFFQHLSDERLEYARKLMKYQNERGGKVVLKDIGRPEKDAWGGIGEAVEFVLAMEKEMNQTFIQLHDVADKHNDPQMSDYVEETFLEPWATAIKKLADHSTEIKRAGPGLGEYLFDKETLDES